ncbi:hypothetical protein R1sor_010134 [Riccia sorocarpa]|uniref:Uncharacterized protein n=1 Tax=Riccia sorocarpa TaxID=122646 RepID=A0ABD3HX84_9MARC
MTNIDHEPGTAEDDLHGTYDIPNVDVDLGIREDDDVVADGLEGIVEAYDTAEDPSGDDFENHADPDDFENVSGDDQNEQDIDNNRGTAEDSGRAGPSRTRPVTEEEVAALERKRDSLWWEVDLLETKKIRFEMEKEELEAAVARNDSELMTAGYLDPHVEVNGPYGGSTQGESRPANRFDELLTAVQVVMDSTITPKHSLASLLAAIDKDAEPPDSPSHQAFGHFELKIKADSCLQSVPERSRAERIPQPPPVEKECVSEDHTIKVTVDNTPVTANTSGGSPNKMPTSQECVSDHQTAEVTTVDEVPVTANTSRTSPHSSQVAQTRKEKRKADSRLEVEPQPMK